MGEVPSGPRRRYRVAFWSAFQASGPTSPGKLGVTRSGGLEADTIAILLAPGTVIALGQAFQMRKYRRLRAQLLAAEISTEQT